MGNLGFAFTGDVIWSDCFALFGVLFFASTTNIFPSLLDMKANPSQIDWD